MDYARSPLEMPRALVMVFFVRLMKMAAQLSALMQLGFTTAATCDLFFRDPLKNELLGRSEVKLLEILWMSQNLLFFHILGNIHPLNSYFGIPSGYQGFGP